MHDFERIDLMLRDIGPASEAIEQIVRNGEVAWDVLLTGDVEIHIELDQPRQRLVFTTDVGEPNPGNLLKIFHALLQFNALREETGGVTMGLLDTTVQQAFELSLAATQPPVLQSVLENLAEKTLTWRIILQSDADDIELPDDEAGNFPGLRV